MTSRPVLPLSVTCCPLAPCVKVVPSWGLISTVPGSPLLNSMVTRSYPGCVPVRTASTNATVGEPVPTSETGPAQTKAGRLESGGVCAGLGLGLGFELGVVLGVGAVPGRTLVWCRLKLATTSTPTTMAAIRPAARPAIQNGPVRAGLFSASAARTRADRAGLGEPLIESNSRLRSRRKFWLMSGHLLEGQVGSEPACGPVDSRLGCRRRHAQGACDLVEGQVEVEVEDQWQALVRMEPSDRSPEVGDGLVTRCIVPPFGFDVR